MGTEIEKVIREIGEYKAKKKRKIEEQKLKDDFEDRYNKIQKIKQKKGFA